MSTRLYVAYSIFYVAGTLFAMQIPFVGFLPIRTSEHMAALGKFSNTISKCSANHFRRFWTTPDCWIRRICPQSTT